MTDNKGFQSNGDDFNKTRISEVRNGSSLNGANTGGDEKYKKKTWSERYTHSLNLLYPFRKGKLGQVLPLNRVGWINYITLDFLNKTMWKGFKKGLDSSDLYELDDQEEAEKNADRLLRHWEDEVKRYEDEKRTSSNPEKVSPPSLSKAVWRFGKSRFIFAMCLILLAMFFQFLGPSIILKYLLDYIGDPKQPLQNGIIILVSLCLCQFLRTITFNLQQTIGIQTGIRILIAVEYIGYKKLLKLSTPDDAALGQFITFLTADHNRIQDAVVNGPLFIGTPIMFIAAIAYSIYIIGSPAILGAVVILLFYPIMAVVATITSILRLRVVSITDARVTMMNEIINSIALIKMYSWEDPFIARVEDLRSKEIKQLRKSNFLNSVTATVSPSITILAGFFTFLLMTSLDYELYTSEAFTILSIYTALQFSVATLPMAMKFITEAHVGLSRLQKILMLKEYSHPNANKKKMYTPQNNDEVGSIDISYATFAWEDSNNSDDKSKKKDAEKEESEKSKDFVCLRDVQLKVESGELIGVAGEVGSGKSSLVAAIMGELKMLEGEINVSGSLAVVSQQAWIFTGTVRDNILLGSSFDESRYKDVLYACSLDQDIKMLNNGDMTVVGERGVTLSGGQRQRVNLARALYSNRDIYILDDPLSAVDARVGEHIFNEYVERYLEDKTVILISHNLQYLRRCDRILVLKSGRITETGTHDQLMNMKNGHYKHLSEFDTTSLVKKSSKKSVGSIEDLEEEESIQVNNKEESTEGSGFQALVAYFKACGGNIITMFIMFFILVFVVARLGTSVWLQVWLDFGDGLEDMRRSNLSVNGSDLSEYPDDFLKGSIVKNPNLGLYQLIYGLIVLAMIVFGIFKGISISITLLRGSTRLHSNMLQCIMRSPLAFFNTTPSGRILNRFSKDMDELDVNIPTFTEILFQYMLMQITQIVLVCVLYPYFIIGFIFVIAAFVFLDIIMNKGVLETKKLDNLMKSSVIHHVTSSMDGIYVIRGYQKEKVFENRFKGFLNDSIAADSMFRLAARWFMFRMESLALVTITIAAIMTVAFKGSVSSSVAGLAMANLFQVCTFISFLMKLKAEYRARLNSIERVIEYSELKQEAAHYIKETKPPPEWPQDGEIEMIDVSFRYRPELPIVLKGISINIRGGEKVGIVGRTGAGKSSLISTILRMTELESGKILIDGVDIRTLGLADLRSTIGVIPQDPVLFQGTIRYNLDPFNEYDDSLIWQTLETTNLKDKVKNEGQKLEMSVDSDGDNFSVGEKQLICLARALLRRNRILLLDEATASVDMKTDRLIQNTIKTAFTKSTVLTIAHRLSSVMDYDKILVLDKGEVKECGTPDELINKDGIFTSMAKAAGIIN